MSNERPLMKCGHVALGVAQSTGKPVCPICIGITPDAEEIDNSPPSLEGRKAICGYCKREADSSYDLPFFEIGHYETHPENSARIVHVNTSPDRYYCGCRGWN